MLSVLLFGIGTAHAVLGVADDVPANALTLPIICGKDATNGLNTVFAVAETTCPDPFSDPQISVTDGLAAVLGHFSVRNSCSDEVWTFDHYWTCHDIESFNCKSIVADMPATAKTKMEITINSKVYYAGYLILDEISNGGGLVNPDLFIGWVYLEDLGLGFASGFNAVGLEVNPGTRLEENAGAGPITAHMLFPRYLLLNNQPETYNWWIILAGRNQMGTVTCGATNQITYGPGCSTLSLSRSLSGVICNEEEDCPDLDFGIPRELNIINVADEIPATIHAGYPKGGFGIFTIVESGNLGTASISITGTRAVNSICVVDGDQYYSIFGWSYQREQSGNQNPGLSWDVIHPVHRIYCNTPEGMTHVTGNACSYSYTAAP